jgi:hypothetical protein
MGIVIIWAISTHAPGPDALVTVPTDTWIFAAVLVISNREVYLENSQSSPEDNSDFISLALKVDGIAIITRVILSELFFNFSISDSIKDIREFLENNPDKS